jgi:IclR family transcriptional regulator, pca regulon regulatory protein
MGRVLLSALEEGALDAYLASVELRPLSPRTVRSAETLRAELAKVRRQGWALVDQELEEGLRSVAAPIRDRSGATIAAVNLSAHASRMTIEAARRGLVPPLLATAARIEADLRAASTNGPRRSAGGSAAPPTPSPRRDRATPPRAPCSAPWWRSSCWR